MPSAPSTICAANPTGDEGEERREVHSEDHPRPLRSSLDAQECRAHGIPTRYIVFRPDKPREGPFWKSGAQCTKWTRQRGTGHVPSI